MSSKSRELCKDRRVGMTNLWCLEGLRREDITEMISWAKNCAVYWRKEEKRRSVKPGISSLPTLTRTKSVFTKWRLWTGIYQGKKVWKERDMGVSRPTQQCDLVGRA